MRAYNKLCRRNKEGKQIDAIHLYSLCCCVLKKQLEISHIEKSFFFIMDHKTYRDSEKKQQQRMIEKQKRSFLFENISEEFTP